MRNWRVIRTGFVALLAAPVLQATPVSMCTQQEVDTLDAYFLRVFQLGLNADALDVDTVIAFAAEGEQITGSLSPDCQSALQRVAGAAQERAQASGRPTRLPSVLYDSASDTYTVPNSVSCGPSGCISLQ